MAIGAGGVDPVLCPRAPRTLCLQHVLRARCGIPTHTEASNHQNTTCAQQPSHSKPVYFESCQGATCCNHDSNTLHTFAIPKLQPSHCTPHTAFSRCLLYLTDLFVLLQCPCYLQRICLCIFTCAEHAASLFLF